MKIFVVDNGGQWTHREWRVLRDLGIETKIIPNTTSLEDIINNETDGLVLSGGAPRIGKEAIKLGNTAQYLDNLEIPILCICVAHQFLAMHFGGEAGPAKIPEFGKTEIVVDEEDDLFKGLPKHFIAWESHNDEIKSLPEDFIKLAHSDNCKYEAIKHKIKPLYGLQFHPEVEHTEHGYDIFQNFITECKSCSKR